MTVLLENFDLLAGSPGGVAKLRELILSLAVRGQLVPQDPNDEPASVLLQKIRAEKDRRIKEGKIKNTESVEAVTKGAYELPASWEWLPLADLLPEFQNGASSRGDKGGISTTVLRLADIKNRRISLSDTRQIAIAERDVKKYSLLKGDLLIVRVNGSADIVGQFVLVETDASIIYCDHFIRMRINQLWSDPHYLQLIGATSVIREKIAALFITTAGQKTINQTHLGSLLIPLPPLAEQSRIVAKFEELMALCDRLEAEQDKANQVQGHWLQVALDQLSESSDSESFQRNWQHLASHWDQLFTTPESITALEATLRQLAVRGKLVPQDPSDQPASELLKQIRSEKDRLIAEGKVKRDKPLPSITDDEKLFEVAEGWEWARFGEILDSSFYGPRFSNDEYVERGGIPTIRTTDMSNGRILLKDAPQVLISENKREDYLVQKGDLLVTRSGSIGVMALFDLNVDAIPSAYLIRFRFVKSVLPTYLHLYLRSPLGLSLLGLGTTAVGVPNINASKMALFATPLPPVSEQARIVAQVEKLLTLTADLKTRLAAAQEASTRLLNTAIDAALNPASADIIAFPSPAEREARRIAVGCHAIRKLADKRYFGRTAAMKLLYFADAHVGLQLGIEPVREAAGPFDRWIYEFEKQAAEQGWFSTVDSDSGGKVKYQAGVGLQAQTDKAASLFAAGQRKEFDRLLDLFADKKTEDAEIIATLFAAWNDFLIDGLRPSDEQIITELRENWHPAKARFEPTKLAKWLDWMRKNKLVPQGRGQHTVHQGLLKLQHCDAD